MNRYTGNLRSKEDGKRNPLYLVWQNMRLRCRATDGKAHRYHARGIAVCEAWHSWPTFAQWATSNGWAPHLELDRINNNKGYSPENCRFVEHKINSQNQERVRPVVRLDTGKVYPSQSEAARLAQTSQGNIAAVLAGKRRIAGGCVWAYADNLLAIAANAAPRPGEKLVAVSPVTVVMAADAKSDAPLPDSIVWMPRGDHEICAGTMHGSSWTGMVRCDELGASVVIASFERARAKGCRVWLDCNHDDGAATADVRSFKWDPARGIVATIDWTPLGEKCLREKTYFSFSPTFWVDWESGRVAGLVEGHAAGGLVNAPAFGAAMPALIAARLGGDNHKPAPGGNPEQTADPMKDILIKLLAALKVQAPADANEEQLVALATKHLATAEQAVLASAEVVNLKSQLEAVQAAKAKEKPEEPEGLKALKATVEALQAAAKAQKKKAAETAVQAAVDRGALKDEAAIRAKWVGLIEADESNTELLAAMAGKPKAESVVVQPDVVQRGAVTAHITREDLVTALKAYHSEKDSKKRQGIYASTIGPVVRDRSVILGPILAANTLGSLSGDLIVQRALTLLKLSFPILTAISTDFSDQGADYNQAIKTRTRAIPAVATYDPDTGYTVSGTTTTDVSVTINNHKAVPISFNANELASTQRDIFGEQSEGCHYALGKALVDALYAVITVANFANETVSTLNDFGRPKVSSMATSLFTRGVPDFGRFLLLAPAYFDKLQQDGSIVSFAAFQRPELITKYMLPEVAGMQPHMAANLPTAETLVGFGGTPDSLVLATRTPNDYTMALPGANNGAVSVVTNPDTGISVQLVQYVDHNKAASYWRIAIMYGVAKGQANSGQRLVSAATS